MKGYKKAAAQSDIAPGQAIRVKVGEDYVGLFNINGQFYAINNVCPHAGAPLSDGAVEGNVVTCPFHGWQFDVVKACAVMSDEIKLKTYDVKLEGESIYISLFPAHKGR